MRPIFFSETVIRIIIKLSYIMGASFTKLHLFLHKTSFIINTLFPTLRDTLYACHIKLLAEVLELLMQAPIRPQNGSLGVHPSGDQKDGS